MRHGKRATGTHKQGDGMKNKSLVEVFRLQLFAIQPQQRLHDLLRR
jgi:hypothetical protein